MRVVVSHSRADSGLAAALRRGFQKLGVSVFAPVAEFRSGDAWEAELRTALEDCDAVVYVAPVPRSSGANSAFFEAGAARALGKPIVTVLPREDQSRIAELPGDLASRPLFIASERSADDLAASVVQRLNAA